MMRCRSSSIPIVAVVYMSRWSTPDAPSPVTTPRSFLSFASREKAPDKPRAEGKTLETVGNKKYTRCHAKKK